MSWHFRASAITNHIFVITVVLLLQCICNGAAIKCFVCDSSDNPSCADLKSNTSIVPEECTLDKMKSIETWLFDLNKFAYFDTGGKKSPLMNCQKVKAKDPKTGSMVTARFCQLDTGESDACSILRSKLRITAEDSQQNNGKRAKQGGEAEEEFHCSICSKDRCNGSPGLTQTGSGIVAVSTLFAFIMQQRAERWWSSW